MNEINLIDEANVLDPDEFARLKSFIVNQCRATSEDIARLQAVRVRDDGATGYSGYWTAKYIRVGADVHSVTCVIVLNAHYLVTVEQLERTLAHEFGHHVTLSNLMDKHEMIGWFNERAPWLYYRIRGLDPDRFAKDYSKEWQYCDKEVMAEDYKYRCSPYTGEHRMQSLVGNPTTEVADYFTYLAKPYWH